MYKKYNKATYLTKGLEQAWTRVQHLQTCDSSKMSLVSRFTTPTRFGFSVIAVLPRGPRKPPNTAQARPIFKHGTVLCCWPIVPLRSWIGWE
jgi:hypothetical protein